jgi:L-iditol 2-dehydrogenase
MGHEFSGVIDSLGPGVEGWKVGDRVVAEANYRVCGKCRYCTSGVYNLCSNREVLGYWHDGVFAPYTVVPVERVHALPPEISFQQGALIEPTACVVAGICELISVRKGDLVLVTGPGTIGLTALQVAKAAGAKVVISGTAQDEARLQTARKLGADLIVNVGKEDMGKRIDELTSGQGVDVAIECAGNDRAVRSCMAALRRQGQYLQLGLLGHEMQLDFDLIAFKQLRVTGSVSSRDVSWQRSIQFIQRGQVTPEALISDIQPLENWEDAFRMHAEKKHFKILFKPEK